MHWCNQALPMIALYDVRKGFVARIASAPQHTCIVQSVQCTSEAEHIHGKPMRSKNLLPSANGLFGVTCYTPA